MRKLSPSQQEVLRLRVMGAIERGMGDEEAVEVFGVSLKSIQRWKVRLDRGGVEALRSGSTGRKVGSGRFLDESQEAALAQAMVDFTPDQLGLGGLLWTSRKVHVFIWQHFRVRFSHGGLIKLFGRLDLSFQRPDRRAREAAPEAIAEWTQREYPAIRARAKAEGAQVMFADQVGARSDHLSGGTWAAKGVTPTVTRSGNRFSLNAMSAISTHGKMYFSLLPDRFNAPTCIAFFEKLIGHFAGEKIHLILDRHAVHRSKEVTTWVSDHAEAIELHFLPAYAPHLNPDELVNADLKRQLTDRIITNRADLIAEVRSIMSSIQKLPARIKSYFHAPHTKYTTDTIK